MATLTTDLMIMACVGPAAFVGRLTGFGFSALCLPVLLLLVQAGTATLLVLVCGTALSAAIVLTEGPLPAIRWDFVVTTLVVGAPAVVGMGLAFPPSQASTLAIAAGVVMLGGLVLEIASRRASTALHSSRTRWAVVGVSGVTAGTLTGTTTLNGPALILGARSLGMSVRTSRATIATSIAGLNVVAIPTVLAGTQIRTHQGVVGALLAASLATFAGALLAHRRLADFSHPDQFSKYSGAVILVAATFSIVSGSLVGAGVLS